MPKSLVKRFAAIGDLGSSRFGGLSADLDPNHAPERQQCGARQRSALNLNDSGRPGAVGCGRLLCRRPVRWLFRSRRCVRLVHATGNRWVVMPNRRLVCVGSWFNPSKLAHGTYRTPGRLKCPVQRHGRHHGADALAVNREVDAAVGIGDRRAAKELRATARNNAGSWKARRNAFRRCVNSPATPHLEHRAEAGGEPAVNAAQALP